MGFDKVQDINQYQNGNKIITSQYVNGLYWVKSEEFKQNDINFISIKLNRKHKTEMTFRELFHYDINLDRSKEFLSIDIYEVMEAFKDEMPDEWKIMTRDIRLKGLFDE